MIRSEKSWIDRYEKKRALWIHDGNPKRPHAVLTAGEHSSGFFNSELVMEDTSILDEAASDLVELFKIELAAKSEFDLTFVDRVVGPAMGAITLAHDLARHIGKKRRFPCLRGFAEKVGEGDNKKMVFKRTNIRYGERLLYAEDVLTTGSSIALMDEAVRDAFAVILPFILVLVNRSGLAEVGGKKIIALIDRPMPKWQEHECPLCAQGSRAIKKPKENWHELTAAH